AVQPQPAARPQPSPAHAEYARRPAAPAAPVRQQSLDPHGRAPARPMEDDHLEIPAFLRRQSS
ncbi:MAG TPA: cell division protein FtsZ, partial [Beijerinckiaceae bacterium]